MDDIRRIATNTLMRTVGKKGFEEKCVLWHGLKLIVKPFLTFNEYMNTINDIISDCCGDDGATRMALLEIAIRTRIISSYSLVRLPTNIDELTYVLLYSDLYQTVVENVCKTQVETIINAAKNLLNAK